MSSVYFKKCDGCDKKIEEEVARIETLIVYKKGAQNRWTDIDVCNSCFEKHVKAFTKFKKKDGGVKVG